MFIRRGKLCMTQNYSKSSLREDERGELQEISATELQQFAIKFVLGVREKNGT